MQDIICKTSYDYETLLKFNKFVSCRKNRRTFLIITQAIAAVLALFVIIASILIGFDVNMVVIIICVVLIELLFLYTICIGPVLSAKKQSKSGAQLTYVLKEDVMEISAETLLTTENITVKYEAIKHFCENDNHFYLFISMNQAYVINADMLETSNTNVLREHLASKIKLK